MLTGARYYTAYGLRVASQIELPHFREAPAGEADVTVRYGAAPAMLPGATTTHGLWAAAPGEFLLNLEGTARYRVSGGREIVVEPLGDDDDLVAVLLAGTVWTALMQQRGLVVLHASAVCADRGALLFLGPSGSGKSTLAAAFAARGYAVVCDDMSAVRIGAHGPVVLPGNPCLRLWADALERLGRDAGALQRVRPGLEKYLLPVGRLRDEPQAVGAAYILRTTNVPDLQLVPLRPQRALVSLWTCSRRTKFVDAFGARAAHFRDTARIAQDVPVVRTRWPFALWRLDRLADRIERDFRTRCPA